MSGFLVHVLQLCVTCAAKITCHQEGGKYGATIAESSEGLHAHSSALYAHMLRRPIPVYCTEQNVDAHSRDSPRQLSQASNSCLGVQVTFRTALDGPAFQGSGFSYTLSGMQHAIGPVSVPTDNKAGFQPGGTTVSHAWGTPLDDLTHMEIELLQPTAVSAFWSCRCAACMLTAGGFDCRTAVMFGRKVHQGSTIVW